MEILRIPWWFWTERVGDSLYQVYQNKPISGGINVNSVTVLHKISELFSLLDLEKSFDPYPWTLIVHMSIQNIGES